MTCIRSPRVKVLSCSLLVVLHALDCFADITARQVAVSVNGGIPVADALASKYGYKNLGQIGSLKNYYLFETLSSEREKRLLSDLNDEPGVLWHEEQVYRRRAKRQSIPGTDAPNFNDPFYPQQWHILGTPTTSMNVAKVWQRGYTGKNVYVAIVDDGMDVNNTDIFPNADMDSSWDFVDEDNDPSPTDEADSHGTMCSGVVGAAADNAFCGTGIAYEAKLSGIRLLGSLNGTTDAMDASALGHYDHVIDVYSNSWGPPDDGETVEEMGFLTGLTLKAGSENGRGGKGSIYVWASGNGGGSSDTCATDAFVNSIYTIAITALSYSGRKPWYTEFCSAHLACAYSGSEDDVTDITTTSVNNECVENFSGTSAAAPQASAIVALALDANPNLSWRDIQHMIVMSSSMNNLVDANSIINGAGKAVSHVYGYGLLDAEKIVDLALRWTTVPAQATCSIYGDAVTEELSSSEFFDTLTVEADDCLDEPLNYLEHVLIEIDLSYNHFGDVTISLESPSGTTSIMLFERANARGSGELVGWLFMSTHFWGENPYGDWILTIGNVGPSTNSGTLHWWTLIIYGTDTDPIKLKPPPSEPPPSTTAKLTTHIDQTTTTITTGTSTELLTDVTTALTSSETIMSTETTFMSPTTPEVTIAHTSLNMTMSTEAASMLSTKPDVTTTATASILSTKYITTEQPGSTDIVEPSTQTTKTFKVTSAEITSTTEAAAKTPTAHTVPTTTSESTTSSSIIRNSTTNTANDTTATLESSTNTTSKQASTIPTLSNRTIFVASSTASHPRCHPECAEDACFAEGPDECVSCRTFKLEHNSTCVSSCPLEYVEDGILCVSARFDGETLSIIIGVPLAVIALTAIVVIAIGILKNKKMYCFRDSSDYEIQNKTPPRKLSQIPLDDTVVQVTVINEPIESRSTIEKS